MTPKQSWVLKAAIIVVAAGHGVEKPRSMSIHYQFIPFLLITSSLKCVSSTVGAPCNVESSCCRAGYGNGYSRHFVGPKTTPPKGVDT